jgi:hypothetical protein
MPRNPCSRRAVRLDHRSQICTALTTLGVEPPAIDVWDFGIETGRITEVPPTS